MTGHRRAMNCRLVMVPPPGDCWVVVERERRVAGQVFFKKGHMPLDWRSKASMSSGRMEFASRLGEWCKEGRGSERGQRSVSRLSQGGCIDGSLSASAPAVANHRPSISATCQLCYEYGRHDPDRTNLETTKPSTQYIYCMTAWVIEHSHIQSPLEEEVQLSNRQLNPSVGSPLIEGPPWAWPTQIRMGEKAVNAKDESKICARSIVTSTARATFDYYPWLSLSTY